MSSQIVVPPVYVNPHPTYNVTIDDSSPLITYEPANAWTDNVYGDPNLFQYYQTSYHYTTVVGASATLTFTGTGVTIMGSKSLTHDAFEVRIDGRSVAGLKAFSSTKKFQQALAVVKDMDYGTHTVQIINTSKSSIATVLDIDAIIVESTVLNAPGNGSLLLPLATFDDSQTTNGTSEVAWSDGWVTSSKSANISDFMNNTVHETTNKGSYVAFDFVGEAIQILGGIGPNNTYYTVQVDDGPAVMYNANASDFTASSTLFFQTNLTSGSHSVTITNQGDNASALTIDAFQIFNSGADPDSDIGPGAKTTPTGVIVGSVIGGIAFLALIIGLAIWALHRHDEDDPNSDKFSIIPPSYVERVKGFLPGSLTRSDSRASGRTAVDAENGSVQRTDEEKEAGYGTKWWNTMKSLVATNPDPAPVTPALPFQTQRVAGGVGEVVSYPVRQNTSAGYGDYSQEREPENSKVWMSGAQRIEDSRRFSDQSLDQAWDNRNTMNHPYAHAGQGGLRQGPGHARNNSTPSARADSIYQKRERRNSDTRFTVSNYAGAGGSPEGTEYPDTPDRPRYDDDRRGAPIGTVADRRKQLLGYR